MLLYYKTLLAMMIAVAPPGQSAHSVVLEPSCGEAPGKPACDITPAPVWSPSYKTFVRRESKEEALRRYVTIARGIEAISIAMTTPVKREDGAEEAPPWPWSSKELAQALVTIAFHESSFRRDVHSGVGPAALGDCTLWDMKGRRVSPEHARTTTVVRTSCQSVCLVQINTGGLSRSKFGFMGKEMVGIDDASTERCFTAGARAFAEARARCAPEHTEGWFARSVASYGTGGACEADEAWTTARASTFARIDKVSAEALSKDVRALLAL